MNEVLVKPLKKKKCFRPTSSMETYAAARNHSYWKYSVNIMELYCIMGLTLDALQGAVLCPDGKRLPGVHLHQDHL